MKSIIKRTRFYVLLIIVLMLCGCGNNQPINSYSLDSGTLPAISSSTVSRNDSSNDSNSETDYDTVSSSFTPVSTEEAGLPGNESITQQQETGDDVIVQTPYCELVVPGEFYRMTEYRVSGDNPCTISFWSKKDGTQLFSIVFDSKAPYLLGTLMQEDRNVVVYAELPDVSYENQNYQELSRLQEDGINSILSHLIADTDFVLNEVVEYNATFSISTEVVTLRYPLKWKDEVDVKVSQQKAEFYCGEYHLFDISFVKCDGILIGRCRDIPIYVIPYDLDTFSLSEETSLKLSEMQEDVNTLIECVLEEPGVEPAA